MSQEATNTQHLDLLWGCAEIAKVIGRSPRATFHMLEKGDLPARKVGDRWVVDRKTLLAFFLRDSDRSSPPPRSKGDA